MSGEAQLVAALKMVTAQVFPDFAPAGTAAPWVTWQNIGGTPLRWLNNTAADKRKAMVQISAWTTSRASTLDLIRQIEDALCASTAFVARPADEPTSLVDQDLADPLYGSAQTFDLWVAR